MAAPSFENTKEAAESLALLAFNKSASRYRSFAGIREKRAQGSSQQMLSRLSPSQLLALAKKYPYIAGPLLGAAGGGLFGLLSSLGKDEEERDTGRSVLTGLLGGGLLGLGGGLAYANRGAIRDFFTSGKSEPKELPDLIAEAKRLGLVDPNASDAAARQVVQKIIEKSPAEVYQMSDAARKLWSMGSRPEEPGLIKEVLSAPPPDHLPDLPDQGLPYEEQAALNRRLLEETKRLREKHQPYLYDPGTAAVVGAGDLTYSEIMRRRGMRVPSDLRAEATIRQQQLPLKGDVAQLAKEWQKLKANGADRAAINTVEDAYRQAKLYEHLKRLDDASLKKLMQEGHWIRPTGDWRDLRANIVGKGSGRVGPEIRSWIAGSQPDLSKAQRAAVEGEYLKDLRQMMEDARIRQGRRLSLLGEIQHANSPLRAELRALEAASKPAGKIKSLFTGGYGRVGTRLLGRGLLYGGLPLAVGYLNRRRYNFDPANHSLDTIAGGRYSPKRNMPSPPPQP